jgi:hypothetical protein
VHGGLFRAALEIQYTLDALLERMRQDAELGADDIQNSCSLWDGFGETVGD